MFTRVCLVHYHEVGLKKRNRSAFENLLKKNITFALSDLSITSVERISGHLLVTPQDPEDADEAYKRLLMIPGIARVSMAWRTGREESEYMKAAELALKDMPNAASFKVQARRANTDFVKNSMELNVEIGAHLCALFPQLTVVMKEPDAVVNVLVIQGSVYTYAASEPGIGGLPAGSGGKVVSLLSSGIDSPVATWRMLRRGAVVVPLHFSGRPQTADTSEYLVKEILDELSNTGGIGRAYIIAFGDAQREIAACVPPDLRIIIYRRIMYQVAEKIAALEGAKAMVTGESLGQVASQTLDNILATDNAVSLPVLRPLIGNDKQEIIAEARRIKTFDISIQEAADCCTLFMPRNPQTHAKLLDVLTAWELFDHETMVNELVEHAERIDLASPAYHPRKALNRFSVWQGI